MLELIAIGAASFGIAFLCVWVYRRTTKMRGIPLSAVALSRNAQQPQLGRQRGFMRVEPKQWGNTLDGRVIRRPWGW